MPFSAFSPGGANILAAGLLLAYQMLGGDNGGWAPGNGRTLMVNDNPSDLARGWREIPSPVQVSYNQGSVCPNFSPTVLPTSDGKPVIHITTDFEKYIGGPCECSMRPARPTGRPQFQWKSEV